MCQNRHGRFTAPDPLLASANGTNPQTFNRYIYTGNNPVNITDPSGLNWCRDSNGIKWTGLKKHCAPGETGMGGLVEVEISRSGRTNNGYWLFEGEIVVFDNATGRANVIGNVTPRRAAAEQGQRVVEASHTTAETIATEAVSAGTSAGSAIEDGVIQLPTSGIETTILSLCAPGVPDCGSAKSSITIQRLDVANVRAPKAVDGIERLAAACSTFFAPCGIAAAVVRGGRGDIRGAGDHLLASEFWERRIKWKMSRKGHTLFIKGLMRLV